MGFRSFLKGKVQKHGGVGGAAKAAIARPMVLFNGGSGMRSSAPNEEVAPDKLQAMFADIPEGVDADGFIAVGPTAMVVVGHPGTFEAADGRAVAVFRVDGALYAIDQACTHEDGPLGEADGIDGTIITCPYHDWKFDVRDGSCVTDPARPVPSYPVKEKDGFIWLGKASMDLNLDRGGEHEDGLAVKVSKTTRVQ